VGDLIAAGKIKPVQWSNPADVTGSPEDAEEQTLNLLCQLPHSEAIQVASNDVLDVLSKWSWGTAPETLVNKYSTVVPGPRRLETRKMKFPSQSVESGPSFANVQTLPLPAQIDQTEALKTMQTAPTWVVQGGSAAHFIDAVANIGSAKSEFRATRLQGAGKEARQQKLHAVKTAADAIQLCKESRNDGLSKMRTLESTRTFLSHVLTWIVFCMAVHICPFRWTWYLRGDMPAHMIAQEENLQELYIAYLGIRVSNGDTLKMMVSAVKTFHSDYLRLTPPYMPRLKREIAMQTKKLMMANPTRRTRSVLSQDNALVLLAHWEKKIIGATNIWSKVYYKMLQVILAVAFAAGFRIGELCPGPKFVKEKFWTIATLLAFEKADPNGATARARTAVVFPMQRKTLYHSKPANEAAQRAFPYEDFSAILPALSTLCAAFQVKGYLVLLRSALSRAGSPFNGKTLPDMCGHTPAFFSINHDKQVHAFTSAGFRLEIKAAATHEGLDVDGLRFTGGSLRRTANVSQQSAGVPHDTRCEMQGRTKYSQATAAYDDEGLDNTITAARIAVTQPAGVQAGTLLALAGQIDHSTVGGSSATLTLSETSAKRASEANLAATTNTAGQPDAKRARKADSTVDPLASTAMELDLDVDPAKVQDPADGPAATLDEADPDEESCDSPVNDGAMTLADKLRQQGYSQARVDFTVAFVSDYQNDFGGPKYDHCKAEAAADAKWKNITHGSKGSSKVCRSLSKDMPGLAPMSTTLSKWVWAPNTERERNLTHLPKGLPAGFAKVDRGGRGNCLPNSLAHSANQAFGTRLTGKDIRHLVFNSMSNKLALSPSFTDSLYTCLTAASADSPDRRDHMDGLTEEEAQMTQMKALQAYAARMARDGEWWSHRELLEIASLFGVSVIVYSPNYSPKEFTAPLSPCPVFSIVIPRLDENRPTIRVWLSSAHYVSVVEHGARNSNTVPAASNWLCTTCNSRMRFSEPDGSTHPFCGRRCASHAADKEKPVDPAPTPAPVVQAPAPTLAPAAQVPTQSPAAAAPAPTPAAPAEAPTDSMDLDGTMGPVASDGIDPIVNAAAASTNAAPLTDSAHAERPARLWQNVMLEQKVSLPGHIWGQYTTDPVTKQWARENADSLFEVRVTSVEPTHRLSAGLYTVRFETEPPFDMRLGDLYKYMNEENKLRAYEVMPLAFQQQADSGKWMDLPSTQELSERLAAVVRHIEFETPSLSLKAKVRVVQDALLPVEPPITDIKAALKAVSPAVGLPKIPKLRADGGSNATLPSYLLFSDGQTITPTSFLPDRVRRKLTLGLKKAGWRLDITTVMVHGKPTGIGVFATALLEPADPSCAEIYSGECYNTKPKGNKNSEWVEHQQMLIANGCPLHAAFDTVDATMTPYALDDGSGYMIDAAAISAGLPRFIQHSSNPDIINCAIVTSTDGDIPLDFPVVIYLRVIQKGEELFIDYNAAGQFIDGSLHPRSGRSPDAEQTRQVTAALLGTAEKLAQRAEASSPAGNRTPAPWASAAAEATKGQPQLASAPALAPAFRAAHSAGGRVRSPMGYFSWIPNQCMYESLYNVSLEKSVIRLTDLEQTAAAQAESRSRQTGFTQDTLLEVAPRTRSFNHADSSRNTPIDWCAEITSGAVLQCPGHYTALVKVNADTYRHIDSMNLAGILEVSGAEISDFVNAGLSKHNTNIIHVLPSDFPVGDHLPMPPSQTDCTQCQRLLQPESVRAHLNFCSTACSNAAALGIQPGICAYCHGSPADQGHPYCGGMCARTAIARGLDLPLPTAGM
jgi:hypothetical protein